MSSSNDSSPPHLGDESAGSSVSSRLQDEYDELLKYAMVMPTYDPNQLPKTLSDLRGSFPNVQVTVHSDSTETETSSVTETRDGDDEAADEDVRKMTPQQSTPRFNKGFLDELLKSEPPPAFDEVKTADLINLNSSTDTLKMPGDDVSEVAYTVTVDQDMTRMESILDQWTYQLKKNVLGEFSHMKIKIIEQYRHQLHQEKERHAADLNRAQNEMEGLKELLHTYEQSIERKDQVISNLTRAMQQQKDRFEMLKTFCEWKIRHNDAKREEFAGQLAMKYHDRYLKRRVWDAWHSILEVKWKNRVEKACQAKAQQVCMDLTNDYEAKLASLDEALGASRTEVERLHAERDRYEETMKKAFMRGVCALNLEAMTMFTPGDQSGEQQSEDGEDPLVDQMAARMFSGGIPQEEVFTTEPASPHPSRVVNARVSQPSQSAVSQVTKSKVSYGKPKTVMAKITGRPERTNVVQSLGGTRGPVGLAPPMSSVMVERHLPVNKSTIGHAVASRYPRPTQSGQVIHSRIAGQAGQVNLSSPNIQTVRVVE